MAESVNDRIRSLVEANKVLLFMKGNRLMPMCGFSAAVVGTLEEIGVPFQTVDVLQDPEIREGVKAYSSWPTIPQLYVQGKFVGGCDIVRDLHSRGQLAPLMREAVSQK